MIGRSRRLRYCFGKPGRRRTCDERDVLGLDARRKRSVRERRGELDEFGETRRAVGRRDFSRLKGRFNEGGTFVGGRCPLCPVVNERKAFRKRLHHGSAIAPEHAGERRGVHIDGLLGRAPLRALFSQFIRWRSRLVHGSENVVAATRESSSAGVASNGAAIIGSARSALGFERRNDSRENPRVGGREEGTVAATLFPENPDQKREE